MQKVILSEYNICLLNLPHILQEYEINIINDLHAYDLLTKQKLTKDVKKMLQHHIIYCICNALILSRSREKKVFYYCTPSLRLYDYYAKADLEVFILKLLNRVKNMLPLCIFYGSDVFAKFCSNITSFKGDGYETLLKLLSSVNTHNTEKFQFNKIKTFAKRNELTFLTKDFFNSFTTKQHLLV